MRLLVEDTNEATNKVVLILTVSEAGELRDKTKNLISRRAPMDHEHIDNDNYQKQITVSIYNIHPISGYLSRYQKLIVEDV